MGHSLAPEMDELDERLCALEADTSRIASHTSAFISVIADKVGVGDPGLLEDAHRRRNGSAEYE